MSKTFPDKPLTLTDEDILSERCVSRRSLLTLLGLGLVTAGAVVGSGAGLAQGRPGCTDNDSGRNEDPPGLGTRCRPQGTRPTGCSDDDTGRYEDRPGYGVRCRPRGTKPTGCTDSDSGPNEDSPGFGTRCWI
jgi:hypothetical protein